jgi:E3 ubiquitin-protein ligase MARCH6
MASMDSLVSSRSRNASQTALPSPSLALYRAPEELEAGPSRIITTSSDQHGSTPESLESDEDDVHMEAEHTTYFRDPNETRARANNDDDGFEVENYSGFESEDETEEEEATEAHEEDEEDEELDMEEDAEFVEDADWEAEEDQQLVRPEAGAPVDGNEQPQAQAQPQPQPEGGDVAIQPDVNDELEGNVEDDLEGAMEGVCIVVLRAVQLIIRLLAIGMRGPIYGVIQNVSVCPLETIPLPNFHLGCLDNLCS